MMTGASQPEIQTRVSKYILVRPYNSVGVLQESSLQQDAKYCAILFITQTYRVPWIPLCRFFFHRTRKA